MTQKDKSLLLQDLCARLPYGVYMHHKNYPDAKFKLIAVFDDGRIGVSENGIPLTPTSINECKPYLRPMSSMTEKEMKYIWDTYGPSFLVADFEDAGDVSELFGYCQMNISKAPSFTDWLNAHHFDYDGLIEKGLALEAPEGMYKTVL